MTQEHSFVITSPSSIMPSCPPVMATGLPRWPCLSSDPLLGAPFSAELSVRARQENFRPNFRVGEKTAGSSFPQPTGASPQVALCPYQGHFTSLKGARFGVLAVEGASCSDLEADLQQGSGGLLWNSKLWGQRQGEPVTNQLLVEMVALRQRPLSCEGRSGTRQCPGKSPLLPF